jgi:uncharacterized repeat protein (TIGR03803 family)
MFLGRGLWSVSAILLVTAVVGLPAVSRVKATSKFKTLSRLPGGTYAGVIFDSAGNLYGTTLGGQGTVFELTHSSNGWAQRILHNFVGGKDGAYPYASLIFDAAGNLYGTTRYGGESGNGTVFELTPDSKGQWTERVLYQFTGGRDGSQPWSGLILDTSGNLYGTTSGGGNSSDCAYSSCGVVFKLTPNSGGTWTESVLHRFDGKDGGSPLASLIFDDAGNLYGTTEWDSVDLGGTVFELTYESGGEWTEHVLHRFSRGDDGSNPQAALIFDAAGDLYGTTFGGGKFTYGVVFELTHTSNGRWVEHVLHDFTGADGMGPLAGVIFDLAGNLYGTTSLGYPQFNGTVFELIHESKGKWTMSVLHKFGFSRGSGNPNAGLIFGTTNELYGTAADGHSYGHPGAVFELTR